MIRIFVYSFRHESEVVSHHWIIIIDTPVEPETDLFLSLLQFPGLIAMNKVGRKAW
jgi:hypothetical protein